MSDFDRIEEHRELVAGLEYEDWWNDRVDEKLVWRRAVLDRDATCVLWHDDCEGELHAHHVVTQQHLRKRGLTHLAWDRRIGVTVCERGHRRHHAAIERICVDFLPDEVVKFVTDLGLDWYLDRYYQPSAYAEAPEPSSPAPDGVSPSRRLGRNSRARLRDKTRARRKGWAA